MKKLIILTIMTLTVAVLIIGCGENPRGTFGPAWDTSLNIPLLESETETINDLLEGQDDFEFNDDNIVEFKYEDSLEDYSFADSFAEIEDYFVIGEEGNIKLDPIETSDLGVSYYRSIPNLHSGFNSNDLDSYDGFNSDDLSFAVNFTEDDGIDFTSLELGKDGIKVIVTNSDGNDDGDVVTINNLKLIFTIPGIDDPIELDYTDEGDINSSDPVIRELNNVVLPGENIEVEIAIETAGEPVTESDLEIEFKFGSIEIVAVEELEGSAIDLADFNESFNENFEIELDSALKSIHFKSGTLTFTGFTELDFVSLDTFKFGVLEADDSGVIDFTGQTVEFDLAEGQQFTIEVGISVGFEENDPITYDSRNEMAVESQDISAEAITVDIAAFDDEGDLNFPIEERFDIAEDLYDADAEINLYDELKKMEVNDAEQVEFMLKLLGISDINGLDMDVDLAVTAYKEGENPEEDDGIETVSIKKDGDQYSFDGSLINLILHQDTNFLVIDGAIGLADDLEPVTISRDDSIEVLFSANIPLDFEITEDIEYEMEPISFDEEVTDDDVETLENTIENARLRAKIDNDLPLEITLQFYVGGSSADEDQISAIKSDLYVPDNMISSTTIKRRTKDDEFEIPFDTKYADKFAEDNPYLGVKIILPEGEFTFRSGDQITIEEVIASFVAKVNQN